MVEADNGLGPPVARFCSPELVTVGLSGKASSRFSQCDPSRLLGNGSADFDLLIQAMTVLVWNCRWPVDAHGRRLSLV
jgi:hypothetical protein